ncbi:hypothetical protein [Mucilaginibacter sp. UYCu711]|uniref:hypothetical protein n=1 Tax=Mucilaginibacter sp. UYCu711 TaxID=3156339 RepID=UPI003D1BB98A
MNTIINNYAVAVAAGNKSNVGATFTTNVTVMPPAGKQPVEGIGKAATMLSAAATAVDEFKPVRSFETNENWSSVVFEGSLDGFIST